jgi:hypothetical protein
MAMNVRLDPRFEVSKEPAYAVDLSEEEASQGHKTGHMRWVLGVGFVLACAAVAGTAVLHS